MGKNKHWRARMEGIVIGERMNGYREGRKEVLEEVKKKFGGSVIIGMGDNGLGVTIKPELDVWLEEELEKLNK